MTRFARAKGSKASNEKLPEQATSWSDMKRELLDKNKELEENKNREKAMQQRQANYQAFLQEREADEVKNINWADFPESQNAVKTPNTSNKRKCDLENDAKKKAKSLYPNFKDKKLKKVENFAQKNGDFQSKESDEEFSALKLQIDRVLDSQTTDNSDSDAPPEEASIKEKADEIIIKKAKKPKQKLQILINQKDKSNDVKQGIQKKTKKEIPKKEVLSDKERRKVEKKQERYKKQLEKKKLKRQDAKFKNSEVIDHNVEKNNNVSAPVKKKLPVSENASEMDAKKLEKKLERRKKQKEKKLKKRQEAGIIDTLENKKEDEVLTEKDLVNIQRKKERRARQAEKRKKFREAKALAAENAETNKQEISASDAHNLKKNASTNINNNNKFKDKFNRSEGNTDIIVTKPYQKQLNNLKEKKVKQKDNKDFQRNKTKPDIMFINGKTVEVDYVDGFPVKKEDADRLKKLRKEMISKGLPRSEINIALKLERRRAEKAFSREKKNVCFNCRKSGHNLSECPELDTDPMAQTSGTGICFKCGSTEHTHFECKVVKGLDYKFATCFICKEQGHISRQCPDNQRGLYPKGGSCKVCGDVTHLKKDCPKYQTQQAQLQSSLSIETLDNRNPDDLDIKRESKNSLHSAKKLNKIRF